MDYIADNVGNDKTPGKDVGGPKATIPVALKLVNVALGAGGKLVHLHFVAKNNQTVTIQLMIPEATKFHQLLSSILEEALQSPCSTQIWH